jgi:hypothetical protein
VTWLGDKIFNRQYWLIERKSWHPDGAFIAGPWDDKKSAKKREAELFYKGYRLTLVKRVF